MRIFLKVRRENQMSQTIRRPVDFTIRKLDQISKRNNIRIIFPNGIPKLQVERDINE